jgi:hypothetical protein
LDDGLKLVCSDLSEQRFLIEAAIRCGAIAMPFLCRSPDTGVNLQCTFSSMLEINEFFQKQAMQCNAFAASAVNRSDREFWLRLAHRWQELLGRDSVVARTLKLYDVLGQSGVSLLSGALLSR